MNDRGVVAGDSKGPERAIISIAVFYIMLRPVSNGFILYPVLAVLASASIYIVAFRHKSLPVGPLALLGGVWIFAVYGAIIGIGNPGVSQHFIVWTVGPLIFGAWALAGDVPLVGSVFRAAAWATITLSGFVLIYVGSELGLLPRLPSIFGEFLGLGFNIEGETTAIRYYGLSTLVAASPMWIVASLVAPSEELPKRGVSLAAALLALIAGLVSGRNAVVLVSLLVPSIFLAVWALFKIGNGRRPGISPWAVLGGIFVLPPLAAVLLANLAVQRTISEVISYIFDGDSQNARTEQAHMLVEAWGRHPFFGNGFGAVIPGYARSLGRPWNFELQYHLLLFQVGIVGTVLIAVAMSQALRIVWLGFSCSINARSPIMVALAGACGMLIANATNPYLQAPGHMWAVWLPILVSGAYLRQSESKRGHQ